MDLLVPEDEKRYRILAERTKFTSLSTLETPLAGSKWDLPEILTFRVLRNKGTSDYPQFLSLFYHDATTTLNDWEDFRNLVDILRERDWANSSRTKLRRIGKDFGPFLSHLAEVIEEKPLARKLPTMTTRQSARVSNMNDKAPEATLPDKKEELDVSRASDEDQSSGSSEATASSFENQPTLAQQVKTETVPNALIIEYLQSLAMCICESDDQRNFCLEWSTNQDNLQFPIPKGKFVKTRNDGGLVNRSIAPRGNWTRVLPLTCYCSIEASFSAFASLQISVLNDFLKAKAVHVVEAKKREVYAQEASQMIGMIHQREENAGHAGLSKDQRIIPLISISQCFVSVTIGKYDAGYYQFLCTGDEKDKPFLHLTEYGPYKLTNQDKLQKVSRLIVALMLFLGEVGPIDDEGASSSE